MSTAQIQDAAYQNAVTMTNQAITFSNNVIGMLNGYQWTTGLGVDAPPTVYGGYSGAAAAQASRVHKPALPGFDGIAAPVKPAAPIFSTPNIGNIPELALAPPTLNFPVTPTTAMPASPGSAPVFNMPSLPTKPSTALPPAPTFENVPLPPTPAIDIPLFDIDDDFGTIISPTVHFEYHENEYQSALLDATKAKLLNDMVNGGYGIDDADERRLWERARERENAAANARIDELNRMHAARGFTLPSGTLYAQQEAVQQDALEKISSISREIMIKKADMYVENRKFTITASTQLEEILIRHFGFVAERTLNAARIQVEMGLAIFNAELQKYNAKVETYRVYASVYEARVRAALASVEVFKAQIEGAKLTVETQKLYADIYQTQINGVTAMANLYKTEMEAAQVAAQIENLKLQAFRAEVETYAERVRARSVEFDMFKAQIEGETAKMTAYDSSVRAYVASVQGYEAKARVAETTARTEIAKSAATLDAYRTDMDRYRTEVGTASEKIKATLQGYATDVQEYAVYTGAINESDQNFTRAGEANARNYLAYSQIVAERLRVTIDQVIKDMDVRARAGEDGARTMASLGSSWASAVTGLSAEIATV